MIVLPILFFSGIFHLFLLCLLMILRKVRHYTRKEVDHIFILICAILSCAAVPLLCSAVISLLPLILLFILVYPLFLAIFQHRKVNFKRAFAYASPILILSLILFMACQSDLADHIAFWGTLVIIMTTNLIISFVYFNAENEIADAELLLWSNLVVLTPVIVLLVSIILHFH